MSSFSCLVIGNESLLIQCAEILRQRGHRIAAVVTSNAELRGWAMGHGLKVEAPGRGLPIGLTASPMTGCSASPISR